MGDRIELRGLTVYGYHGVFDSEKTQGQDFVIDVVLHTDLVRAGASDDLADTIDYGSLADEVAGIVQAERFDLIEALASAIAEHCLTKAPCVEVTVHKPQAPIARDFSDVAVHLERTRRRDASEAPGAAHTAGAVRTTDPGAPEIRAVLSLGSNMGSSARTLDTALAALAEHPRITVESVSGKYTTAPVGGVEQDDFLNAAAVVTTTLTPRELLAVCQGIELAHGRRRQVHWGPRTLDIDIIRIAGSDADIDSPAAQLTSADPVLRLPHPESVHRAFVLVPWAELRPLARIFDPDPERTGTVGITDLARGLEDQGIRKA